MGYPTDIKDNDPFSLGGEKQTPKNGKKQAAATLKQQAAPASTQDSDPFSLDTSIKKKEPSGEGAPTGTGITSPSKSSLSSNPEEPDQYGRTGWMKTLPPPIQLPQSDNPINDAMVAARSSLSNAQTDFTLEGFQQRKQAKDAIKNIQKNAFTVNTGKEYLSKVTGIQDLDAEDPLKIKATLDPNNITQKLAFDKYLKGKSIDNALNSSGTFDEGAIKYAASQNSQIAAQVKKMGGATFNLPNAFAGTLVANSLYDPDVIEKVKGNPELEKKWKDAEANLYNTYPDFAKTHVAQVLSQAREDRGMNSGIGNAPTKETTDKLFNDLVDEKVLSEKDRHVYQTELRPYLGTWRSVGRGIGRLIAPAFVNESPIKTTDVLSTFEDSYVNTLRGAATSIEDLGDKIARVPTLSHAKIWDDEKRLKDLLQHDYSTVSADPATAWHDVTSSTGNITGFVLPMILGGEAGAVLGASPIAAEMGTSALIFEGHNSDEAAKKFAGDTKKQFLYTTIATAGDMMLARMLPTKEAIAGTKNLLKPEIVKVIEDFTDGKITADAAKKTIFDKGKEIVTKRFPQLVEDNAKTGAVMSGFSLFHNGLDAISGGRDVSMEDAANEAMNTFKSGFLGSTLLSLPKFLNSSPKLTGKVVREMANNPAFFKKVIEDGAEIDPKLDATKNERIANLNEAAIINSELDNTTLTDAQKEKYLISALSQKIWEKKAENATDDVFKKDFTQKAKEAKETKEA
ncbi:MAG: hypothetical protein KW793_04205, partial [Candidatus Doudnabacteria bacterium]|nr:hypothetical protein [Candidatus Doudnabacteria bacterium]